MNTSEVQAALPLNANDPTTIRVGYKWTEVGMIPEEWEAGYLGDKTTKVGSGVTPTGGDKVYRQEGRPFLRSQNIGWGTLLLEDIAFIDDATHDTFKATEIKTDDVFVNITGASIGRSAVADARIARGNVNQHVCIIRTNQNQLHPRFLNHFLLSKAGQRQIDSFQAGGNRQGLNFGQIRSFRLPVPPLPEQRAIASALSDVDGLIGALEKLIAKKRAIKQAAMQQLLTGRTRLPGFSGKWETKRLGDFASIRNQKVLPINMAPDTPCVELEHIGSSDGRLLASSTAKESTSVKYSFRTGDVLFGRLRSYLRKFWLADRDGICTTEIWPLTVNSQQAVAGFLRAVVQTDRFIESASISYGTHMPRADWGVMRNFEVPLPRIDEQQAIAVVFSDMDSEIEALERRRDKTKQIKQGVMQQLLTGRIRLVKPQAPVMQAETDTKGGKSHNWAFNEAVVISTLAQHFGTEAFPLGRKRYTKLSYLLHRHAERQATGYLKKAAGPYNPKTKYGGPERIALENSYVREHKNGTYIGFVAADNIAQAEGYFEKWYGSDAIQWLEQFRYKKNDELEVLATVDMAAEALRASGNAVDVTAVKGVIRSNVEWQAKLDRPIFSDAKISEAVEMSRKLFGSNGKSTS